MVRRRLHVLAWVLGILLLVVFGLRTFVANVYPVRSGSMKPTLWADEGGGEQVLVRFVSASDLERYDLVVLRRGDELFVKRLAGLPGESIQVRGGDLWIDGSILTGDQPKPPWIPVFPPDSDKLETYFRISARDSVTWDYSEGRLHIEPAPGSDQASRTAANGDTPEGSGTWDFAAQWIGPLRDAFVDPSGEFEAGTREVGDLRISARITPLKRCGSLALELAREGDRYLAELRIGATSSDLVVHGWQAEGRWIELGVVPLAESEGPRELSLVLRDRCLSVNWGDQAVWLQEVPEPSPASPPTGSTQKHIKPRVALRARGAIAVDLEEIRVDRDLHYTGRGEFGVIEPLVLGPDQYFVLGDNSAISADSREWGVVGADQVIGRASAVVWPPSRWRWLEPTDDPPIRP